MDYQVPRGRLFFAFGLLPDVAGKGIDAAAGVPWLLPVDGKIPQGLVPIDDPHRAGRFVPNVRCATSARL